MRLKEIYAALQLGALVVLFGVTPIAHAETAVVPGDLIRGTTLSTVYYVGPDGLRYAFPNEKVYKSWYSDFSTVHFVSDATLQSIDLAASNVTYRPGVRLVKIDSDPYTYIVDKGAVLHHVLSEGVASAIYGLNWSSYIDDVPTSFWGNYTLGAPIGSNKDFIIEDIIASAATIAIDKNLHAPATITIDGYGFSPTSLTVPAGTSVRFVNADNTGHTATDDRLRWGTGTIQPGATTVKTFSKVGTYSFFDSLDSQNTAAIYVVE